MMRTRTVLCLALLASTAACGGGGGGSAAPASSGAAPAQSAATAPSTNIANPQVAMTSDGRITFANDKTSQTVTNEDVLTIHVAGVVDQSFDFANDPLNTTTFNADSSSFAQIDKVDAGGNKVSVIKFNDGSQLDATTFGIWQKFDKGGNMTASGAFSTGTETRAEQMPTSGTATYAGQAIGTGKDGSGSFTLTGTSNLNADFGSRNVSGSIQLSKVGQDATWTTLQFSDAAIAANSNKFAGTIASADRVMSGGVQGAFYGTGANARGPAGEVAGTFGAAGGGQSVTGAFGAAKQ